MMMLLSAGTTEAAGFLSGSALTTLWTGIIIYLAILLGIGIWSGKHVKDMNDYLVAGRRLPLWLSTGTLLATWFGAGSSMGVCASVYSSGLGSVLADPFAASFSLILAGVFVVGLLRKLKCLTVTDIIARRFGNGAGIYASLWMVPVYVGWLGAQVLGMGTILHILTGIAIWKGTLIGSAVILIYTFIGGMWAVTMTDIIQVGLIVLGLLIILPNSVSQAGGFDKLFASLSPDDLSIGWGTPRNVNDIAYYMGSWMIMGLGCMVGQDLIQRSMSCKSAKVAVSSTIISGFLYAIVGLIPITIGFAARIVLAKHGISADSLGENLDNQVMPRMAIIILGAMHPVMMTLFLAALISAIMSSAASSLLAGSSLLVKNVIGGFFPHQSDKALLLNTRISTIVLTVIATWFAINANSIYSLMINSWASQLVVIFVPVMISLYIKHASRASVWATMTVSTAVWIVSTFIGSCGSGGTFYEILNSDRFEHALTCGAVYAFFSGIATFLLIHAGERISSKMGENYRKWAEDDKAL